MLFKSMKEQIIREVSQPFYDALTEEAEITLVNAMNQSSFAAQQLISEALSFERIRFQNHTSGRSPSDLDDEEALIVAAYANLVAIQAAFRALQMKLDAIVPEPLATVHGSVEHVFAASLTLAK